MKYAVILIFVCLSLSGNAQTYRHVAGQWTAVQLNLDLPKRFSVSVQYQLRLDRDLYRIKGSYFSGSVQYELVKKYLSAEVEYRYRTSKWVDQHRFGIGLTAKYKFKVAGLSLRTVYQRGHEYFNSVYEPGHEPTNYLRNRVQVKFDLKKRVDLGLSLEPYLRISNKFTGFDRLRSVVSVNWEPVKRHHLQLFYLNQFDLAGRNRVMEHITGLAYSYDVPRLWKSKKDSKMDKEK